MKDFIRSRLIPFSLRHLAALACIAITRLILQPIEPYLGIEVVALFFLLPVMISTVLWGLTPGILASLAAFLVFNYFYIQPYHTFRVHRTQDLITLIIFLIVSVVMSQLIGRAREGVRLAQNREWEATRMYELISALASLTDSESISQALARLTMNTFRFDRVTVVIDPKQSPGCCTASADGLTTQPGNPDLILPLQTARGNEGEMRIWQAEKELTSQQIRLLETYTSQGALALERIRLAKGENKARVLEESDKLKSSLLNSVSHELRSPLAAIKASVSSLRSGMIDWNNAARLELLATIEEETDHLNFLVGNLLDMSRIESGALKPQIKWNSIEEIAMGVVTRMRKQLQDHPLEAEFPADLPLIPSDYILLEQVFTNLISNSVKYAPSGTPITINSYVEEGNLHTRLTNQGPAVPAEDLKRIFDKFYRITAADRVTGTGLGLSICKGIIEAHGGHIWAENDPPRFVFHFTLPLTLNGELPSIPKETSDG